MTSDRQLLMFLLVVLIIIFFMSNCDKEGYVGAYDKHQTVTQTADMVTGGYQFPAQTDPRMQTGGAIPAATWGYPTAYPNQAAPLTPTFSYPTQFARQPTTTFTHPANYAELGGKIPTAFQMTDNQGANLTSEQVAKIVGSGTPEYQETADIMPIPDMKGSQVIDPTDQNNFVYERSIFAKLKRRYGNEVDFIRGDLQINPEKRGWFDIRDPSQDDIVTGYFDNYIDIQQTTDIRDAIFERSISQGRKDNAAVNPYGDTAQLVTANL